MWTKCHEIVALGQATGTRGEQVPKRVSRSHVKGSDRTTVTRKTIGAGVEGFVMK